MGKYLLILCSLSLCTNALAANREIPLKEGMSYETAASELRRSGWTARTMHAKSEYTYIGIENTMLSHGVKGIESCAVDRPVCLIHYTKGDKCLRVVTWGEEFKNLKIDTWDHECPPKDAL
jgi:hypothetical protein